MMINKRLIGTVSESKKYIAANVALQWCSLAANIVLVGTLCRLLGRLYLRGVAPGDVRFAAGIAAAALVVRWFCTAGAARMGYLSSRAVKRVLREKIYGKL
ncbi:MAG: cysteine ABC transporter ATP-binding protein, partial [Gemmiger sp.]